MAIMAIMAIRTPFIKESFRTPSIGLLYKGVL